jgi:hypothetical protein
MELQLDRGQRVTDLIRNSPDRTAEGGEAVRPMQALFELRALLLMGLDGV